MSGGDDASSASLQACLEQVRQGDRDRYLCALAAPGASRPALLALLAFNLEIARTRELVREPMLGQIRLQWWRDSLAAIRAGERPRTHPVVEALAAVAQRLPHTALDRLIDGRERDLDDAPYATLDELEAYVAGTAGELARTMVAACGADAPAAQAAATEVGLAFGLVGLIRAVPFHAAHRRLYLPADLLRAAAVEPEALFTGRPPAGLAGVLQTLAARAHQAIAAARARRKDVPAAAVPALLQAVLAERHLARLARQRFDVFGMPSMPAPALLPLAMLWHSLRNRY